MKTRSKRRRIGFHTATSSESNSCTPALLLAFLVPVVTLCVSCSEDVGHRSPPVSQERQEPVETPEVYPPHVENAKVVANDFINELCSLINGNKQEDVDSGKRHQVQGFLPSSPPQLSIKHLEKSFASVLEPAEQTADLAEAGSRYTGPMNTLTTNKFLYSFTAKSVGLPTRPVRAVASCELRVTSLQNSQRFDSNKNR